MATQAATSTARQPRRWLVLGALVLVQILLMAAAFVGGRMLAEQNQRTNGQSVSAGLASELPKDPAASSGTVQKIQGDTITLTQGGGSGGGPSGGPGGPPGQSGPGSNTSTTNSQTTIMVTTETKYYKGTSSGGFPGMPGGEQSQSQVQVQAANLADIKVGNILMVWGNKSGETITAEVIYIQTNAFGP